MAKIRGAAPVPHTRRLARRLSAAAASCCLAVWCASSGAQPAPPSAASVPATDAYPGFEIVDPYRNLEDLGNPDTQAWMKGQAEHARRVLDAIPERARIRAALDTADASRAYSVGTIIRATPQRTFFTRRDANAAIARLFIRDGDSGEGRAVFDPSQFDSPGQTHAISFFQPSPNGRRVAVGVAANGSEQADVYVYDVDDGRRLDGPLPRSWFGIVWWVDDDRLMLGRLKEAEPGRPANEAWQDSQAWLHRVGTPIADDAHLFGTQSPRKPEGLRPETAVGVLYRQGEPHAVGIAASASRYYAAWTQPATVLASRDAVWRPLFTLEARNQIGGDIRDGQLYAISDGVANGEIVRYDLSDGTRHVLRAAGARPIEDLGAARDALYFRERDGVYTLLRRIGYDGSGEAVVGFPRKGNPMKANDNVASTALDGMTVLLDSWTEPSADYRVEADGSVTPTGLLAQPAGLDLRAIQARDLVATSHDGTRVPLTLVHLGPLQPAAQQPVLMSGYGAYGMSMDPMFAPTWYAMLQQGLALAICHVRGGGEYGPAWHEAGRLANKANTWKDFIACAETLVEQGVTRPARLVGMGTSAGGITISNAVAERPDLFAGAVNDVGVSDVLRSLSASQNGPGHYEENGDIRTAEGAAIARASSGYEKIAPDRAWPPWLVIHGANDPRVEVWQSNKFVARMAAASDRPVIYRLDYASGHGMGSTADARKDWAADIAAFVFDVTREAGPGRHPGSTP